MRPAWPSGVHRPVERCADRLWDFAETMQEREVWVRAGTSHLIKVTEKTPWEQCARDIARGKPGWGGSLSGGRELEKSLEQ